MGHAAAREILLARWAQLVNDASLRDLPYKIELNEKGVIEMSPASPRHGMQQMDIGTELKSALPDGKAISECPILTDIGIRAPDVIWASNAFLSRHSTDAPFSESPEICVEVLSPSNTDVEIAEKIRAYLAAGALEVWVVEENGTKHFFTNEGEQDKSSFLALE